MIRTHFNNQPKFGVLELRMGRHMNLFDRRVIMSSGANNTNVTQTIIADDEIPAGYRCFIWGMTSLVSNATAWTNINTTAALLLQTGNSTTLVTGTSEVLNASKFTNFLSEPSLGVALGYSVLAAAAGKGEYSDDGYGLKAIIQTNSGGTMAGGDLYLRIFGCVAPAQLTTAQWSAGAGGAGSGTGGGNDQQIR